MSRLQQANAPLEERNHDLQTKLERVMSENKNLKDINKTLLRQKDQLVNELQGLQASYNTLDRTHQQLKQTVRQLEFELSDTRNKRNDLCSESKIVLDNVKAWLGEQRKINDQVKKKARDYSTTIERLKQENE